MNKIKRNILLNPGPATTTDTVKYAQVVPDICPRESEFTQIMNEIRKDLLKIVHAKDDYSCILFTGSGTICMDVAINSLLDVNKKALIICNGSYSQRAVEICQYYGIDYIQYNSPLDESINLKSLKKILVGNKEIGFVYLCHHETGSGLLNPVREIGEIAHEVGVFSIVDTTSSYGMKYIDLYKDNIDVCMSSAQKGIMSMTGLSFVIARKDIIEKSKNFPKRSYYCNLYRQYEYFERTGQMNFTPPVQIIYATRQALKEYFQLGERKKIKKHYDIMLEIKKGVRQLGLKEYLPENLQSFLVDAIIYPDDERFDFNKIHDYCYKRGYTIYPGKMSNMDTFRLCSFGALDNDDIIVFFDVLKEAFLFCGMDIPVKYN